MSPIMKSPEFSLSSYLIFSLRFTDKLCEKYLVKSLRISSILANKSAEGASKSSSYVISETLLSTSPFSSYSFKTLIRSNGSGLVSCDKILITLPNLILSLGSIFVQCTMVLKFLMMGTEQQKLEQLSPLIDYMGSPLITISFFYYFVKMGELLLWNFMPKSFQIEWQATVSMFLFLRRWMRYTPSKRQSQVLLYFISFLRDYSFWQTQTIWAYSCNFLQILSAPSSTHSSSQKQCSSKIKLTEIAITVSLLSAVCFCLKMHLSLLCNLLYKVYYQSQLTTKGAKLMPLRVGRESYNLRETQSFQRALIYYRFSWVGCCSCRARGTILRVCRMLNLSVLRWLLEVLILMRSKISFFSLLIRSMCFSFSMSLVQYSSTERLQLWWFLRDQKGYLRSLRQTMLTLRMDNNKTITSNPVIKINQIDVEVWL